MRDRIYKGQAQGALGRSVDAPFQRLDKKRPRGEWPEWEEGEDKREEPQADTRNVKIKEGLD